MALPAWWFSAGSLVPWVLGHVSYRVVAACLALVPLTHCAGIAYVGAGRPRLRLLLPLAGGNRHIVLQLAAWLLWSFALLLMLPIVLSGLPLSGEWGLAPAKLPRVPRSHTDVVSGAAAALSFVSEMLLVKAVLVYDAPAAPNTQQRKARPVLASAIVVLLGLLLSVTGVSLLAMLEHLPDVPSRLLYTTLATCCLLIATTTTYGLGGFLRHGAAGSLTDGELGAEGGAWAFWQPFAGGTAFIVTQAISWSLFATTVVCLATLLGQLVAGVAACWRCWALGVGFLMVLVQALQGVSLLLYRAAPKGSRARELIRAASGALQLELPLPGRAACSWLDANLPILLMYLPVHSFFAAWVASFVLLPTKLAMCIWCVVLPTYYGATTAGHPAHTGCRQWPWLMAWFQRSIEASLSHWFGSVEVIMDGQQASATTEAAPPLYLFGFQPHGYYPTGAGFLPWLPSFRRCFGAAAERTVTLVASVLFIAPLLRDIAAWAGFRQVGHRSFVRALAEGRSVMFCPGGQAELVHTGRAFAPEPHRQLVIHTRHKGFCRLAIEHGAQLVPILALGESLQLANLVDAPRLQQLTYRRLGFPIPFVLVGRWWLTPLPRKTPLVYVIGRPLVPPHHTPGTAASQADVDALHAAYYASLADLWQRHRHRHPHLAAASLVLTDD